MMKMRAVPDDFDNVQALHSPYGAVHAIGTPMQSPVDYSQSYGDPGIMRPLMVDTMRRQEHDDHLSPTGLSPAFGHVGFNPQNSMNTPDMLSPLSLAGSDRYYSSHLTSPMSAGPRSSFFNRQNNVESYGMHPARTTARPLQPLQLRETMSRSRSESLQSPLRSSMSWKGDSLDYSNYPPQSATSPNLNGRQQSLYQSDQQTPNPVNTQQYDNNQYSSKIIIDDIFNSEHHNNSIIASNVHTSPTHLTYPTSQQQNPSQPSTPPVPRFRSASSAFPSGLDLRNQYRGMSSQNSNQGVPTTPRTTSFASAFSSGGFQSAPLMAPAEFQIPRTPIDAGPRDYHMSQLSAPMAPPQDFSAAYSQSMSPGSRTPVAEQSMLSRNEPNMQEQQQQHQQQQHQQQQQHSQQQQQQQSEPPHYLRQDEYDNNPAAQKRKRTYSMSGTFEGQ
jgi:hypothetical protein